MIKQVFIILLIALTSVFLQATVFGTFFPRFMIPNLCLSIVLFISIFEANLLGAVLSFFVGLFLDLSSGALVGPWSGAFVALFGLLSQGGRKLFIDSVLTIFIISFFAGLFSQIVYLFLLSQFKFDWAQLFSLTYIGTALISAVCSPTMFSILRKLYPKSSYGAARYIQQRLF